MKSIFFIFIAFILSFSASVTEARSGLRSNLAILDSLSDLACNELSKEISYCRTNSIDLNIDKHPAKYYIKQKTILAFKTNNIKVFEKTESSDRTLLNIIISECEVRYELMPESNDSLFRISTLKIAAYTKKKSSELEHFPLISLEHKDNISTKDIQYVKSSQYPFSDPQVPEPELTFFEEFAEPLILVSSAILTVLLLFSVRSQ